MTRAKSGGGLTMNKVSHVAAAKKEPVNHPVSLDAVSRIGSAVGVGTPHANLYNKIAASTPQGPTDNTKNLGPGGCGRQVMRSGSQGTHGSTTGGVARPGANKPIFPGFD
jgi:hypothetical protein